MYHDSPRYSLAAAFLPDITAVNVRLARHIQRDNAYLAVYSGPPRARRPVLSCAPGAVPSVRPSVRPSSPAGRPYVVGHVPVMSNYDNLTRSVDSREPPRPHAVRMHTASKFRRLICD